MERSAFSATLALTLALNVAAQQPARPTPEKFQSADNSIVFTENLGQVHDQRLQPRPDVLFGGSVRGLAFHLRNNGISYQLRKGEGSLKLKQNIRQLKDVKIPTSQTICRLD